ncbi:hypothetical protein AVEN_38843-1 [Araneus ventricosus]|uniref:Uncharacterized protein n=1 Tax=Araneus ventricosus TaxID=182803 RepID=A0A4Y2ME92_ARAVE|nr:hypothetical protein AVEN_38843-1 [Araneus ventricosus]
MKFILFFFLTFDLALREQRGKKEQKIHTLKNSSGNQIEIDHSFPDVKRKANFGIYCSWVFKRSLTADMDCAHQQVKLLAQAVAVFRAGARGDHLVPQDPEGPR